MRGLAGWLVLLCGVAWGQGVVVRPPEAPPDARPEMVAQVGHTGMVTAVAFSPDGRYLASAATDQLVLLWDLSARCVARVFEGHTGAVKCVAFSPDGRLLASGGDDGTARLWQVETGQAVGTPWQIGKRIPPGSKWHYAVFVVVFSPDGASVAVGGGTSKAVHAGSSLGALRSFDVASGAPRWEVRDAFLPTVTGAALSSDGGALVTSHLDGSQRCWNPADGRPVGVPLKARPGQATAGAISPDGRLTATAGDEVTAIVLREVATDRSVGPALRGHVAVVNRLAVSPNSRTLVTTDSRGYARLWDLGAGQPRGAPAAVPLDRARPSDKPPLAATDGVPAWDASGALPRRIPVRPGLGRRGNVLYPADGRILAVLASAGGPDDYFRLWDVEHDQPCGPWIRMSDGRHVWVALSPDGRTLASGELLANVRLWDATTGRVLREFAHSSMARALAFAPDGRTLAAGYDRGIVLLWDRDTGQARGEHLQDGSGNVCALYFSPDGRLLAARGADEVLRVWDLAGKGPLPVVVARLNNVVEAAFLPDGRRIVTRNHDGSCTLWDAATFCPIATFISMEGGTQYLTTTPGGFYDASIDSSNAVAWRIGDRLYPFDQFAEKYNRPDLVRRALAGEDISNAPPLDATQLPPNLGFISPQYGAEVAGDQVEVELQAAGKYPIRRLELTVNGTPLPADLARQLEVQQPDQTTRTFKLTIPLPPNEPRIRLRAVAYDTESLKSLVQEITIFRPGVKEGVGALHVLAVGINRYPKLAERYQLRFAAPDAQAVADALGKLGGGKPYAEVRTRLLLDDQATVTNLKFALRELKDTATENDVAVIFVSGHGVADKAGSFYFPTCDVDLADIGGTALSWQDFVGALRDVRAKRVLVLADTCHSGAVVGQGQSADEQLAKRLNKEGHRLVFAASGRDEVSVGSAAWGHGAFTKALLEALEGKADGDQDRRITFAELRDYVPGRVAELTGNRQHPQLPFLDSFEPEAVFARLP